MGTCGFKSSHKSAQINVQNRIAQSETNNQMRNHSSRNPQAQESEKERIEFKDFEEDNTGKMIDEGIKQIPSYKCPIPFDELRELREKFWQSKIKTNRRWKAIREICESDAATSVQLLEAAGFICKDNLRQIMEVENFDIIYKIPNFCIADPVFERDYNVFKNTDKYPTKDMNIVLYCSMTNKDTNLLVSNKMLGKELKQFFAKKEGFDLEQYSIRLFYSGQEIKDDYMLYYYNLIDNNSKLQVMSIKKPK